MGGVYAPLGDPTQTLLPAAVVIFGVVEKMLVKAPPEVVAIFKSNSVVPEDPLTMLNIHASMM